MSRKITLSKLCLLLVLIINTLAGGSKLLAQTAGSYTFAQTSGTYTPITGGTVINTTIPDSWQSLAIPLTPGFYFCGTMYTTAYMTSNGVIGLGGTAGPGTGTYNGIATTGGGSGVNLCPFGADQIGSSATGATPEMRYQLVGNEHVFQWKDISRYPATTDRFSYQARLNTITGTVTYIYSVNSVGTSVSYQPAVGIRTATTAGNWQSRTVASNATSSWAASALSTVTGDLCRFTSATTNPKQPVSGQTYVYTPPTPPPSCTSLTFPATSTTTASPNTICLTGNVTLGLGATIPLGGTGITFAWQSSPNNTTWTDIATTYSPTYTTTMPITASTWYRCIVRCNTTTVLTSTSVQAVVNNPGTPVATNGSRCGPGTVNLSVTPPAGTTVNWYAAATGGAPINAGNTFTTPFLTANTTYYATAGSGATTVATGKPTPVSTNGNSGFSDVGLMFDAISNFTILSVDVYPVSTTSTSGTVTIDLKNSLGTTLQSTTANVTVSAAGALNVVPLNFTVPPGTGYRLVVTAATGMSSLIRESLASAINFPYTVPGVSSITSAYTGGPSSIYYYYLYNWLISTGCEGNRVPVTATITPSTPLTKTVDSVVCNDAVSAISITSPAGNYASYVWTPTTNLYTNAAATTPYTGGSATTVYHKSGVVGNHTISVYATNTAAPQCAAVDTARVWVQPDSVYIVAYPDTLCAPSGATTVRLVPETGYKAGTIQWQISTDGITYTNIAGATNATYPTGTLTANRWYKALIKAGNTICESPTKKIVIADPQLLSYSDSFNCGPGTVTLTAAAGGNGMVRWYNSPTSNIPIGSGDVFVTPYLAATTDFYVDAGTGSIQPSPTNVVVTGTQTTGATSAFLYYFYKGAKNQYIITAAEMTAQGYSAGLITSLGLQTGTIGNATMNNFTIEIGHTNLVTLPAVFQTGLQQVYTAPTYTLTANAINTFTFQTPFYWNGIDNIIVGLCRNNNVTNTSVNNFVYRSSGSSVYRYGDATDMCTAVSPTGGTSYGPYTSAIRPHTIFTLLGGCVDQREQVTAYIHPKPAVDLGPDINKCVDAGAVEVLNAGVQPNLPAYLWDNGSTSQVRAITASGNYNVKVTNQYGCVGADTIQVTLRANPVVNLGNDTSVCNGVNLTLNAGNDGIDYFWNTGAVTQSINVNAAGTYNVFVTNGVACTKSDTITIVMQGELPTVQGIAVNNNGQYTFQFSAINPQNVIGYEWDFGDGSLPSYTQSPIHTYPDAGNYIVVLRLSSSCGFTNDSTSAHIVGLDQLNVDNGELSVYPNPTQGQATIISKGALKMEKVEVYNILGQQVYSANADNKEKHSLDLNRLASGVYTIQVFTDKGNVARKLEILK